MKRVKPIELETNRLILKIPTYEEQYALWNILKKETVNLYYQKTPSRFKTRKEYQEAFQNWDIQKEFFYKKVDSLNLDSDMYTWSIFYKETNMPIGQITVQPNDDVDDLNIRSVGWYIDPEYQGQGLGYEASKEVLTFMFNKVEIECIDTKVITSNRASWSLMEKLGFERTGIIPAGYKDMEENELNYYTYMLTRDKFLEKE